MDEQQESSYVTCPFCGEGGFDLIGLKGHFEHNSCDVYEQTESPKSLWQMISERTAAKLKAEE